MCDGPGFPVDDAGVTGLATIAFLAGGEGADHGKYRETVGAALKWILAQQDTEGCFGPRLIDNYVYGHAICTIAVIEAYRLTGSPLYRDAACKRIDYIQECRNPYRAWRYGRKPGDNDASVTSWMMLALGMGDDAGLPVDTKALVGARQFLSQVTGDFGDVGYTQRGKGPNRPEGKWEEFPPDLSESLTAAGMMDRMLAGESPEGSEAIRKGAERCGKKLPNWERYGARDFYYWFFGTLALYQVGGKQWDTWDRALGRALLGGQRRDEGCARGSWDPAGAWGEEGGRVYSTAILAICLEVPRWHARVFEQGAR